MSKKLGKGGEEKVEIKGGQWRRGELRGNRGWKVRKWEV